MNAFKNDLHDLVARHVAAARGDNNRMLTQLAASEARQIVDWLIEHVEAQ